MSMATPASLDAKIAKATKQEMMAPVCSVMPKSTLSAMPLPAILPILKARPPITISSATKWPRPGRTLLATSCPRIRLIVITRQTFIWAPMSMMMEAKIAKAKLAPNFSVNTVVWVKNPGPMAEVAIIKAAPSRTDQFDLLEPDLEITGSAITYDHSFRTLKHPAKLCCC